VERVKMSRENRAKQFAPFNALKGFQEALRMKEYEHDRTLKNDLDEEKILSISKIILNYKKNSLLQIKFFHDGYYKTIQGKAKIFISLRYLEIENIKINFDDIFDLKIIDEKN